GVRAVQLARRGCELTKWQDANLLDTLSRPRCLSRRVFQCKWLSTTGTRGGGPAASDRPFAPTREAGTAWLNSLRREIGGAIVRSFHVPDPFPKRILQS